MAENERENYCFNYLIKVKYLFLSWGNFQENSGEFSTTDKSHNLFSIKIIHYNE